MKIQHFFRTLVVLAMLATVSPAPSAISKEATPIETPENQAMRLKQRLNEIKAMDTKSMTKEQKKQLRVEVRAIKKELKTIGGGVYLSVGAIILIVLLILLLA